jgi:SAM-dependent methyltransferase
VRVSHEGGRRWEQFWAQLVTFVAPPDPMLCFEFLPDLGGISYQLVSGGAREEFLRSDLLVRDRKQLDESEMWQKHGATFKQQFLVCSGTQWHYCPATVWSPSVDAEVILHVAETLFGLSDVESILDLGCGTGVLGLGLARLAPALRRLALVDSDPRALAATALNAACQGVEDVDLHVATVLLPSVRYDLGVTAPYYFPVATTPFSNPHVAIEDAGYHTADLVRRGADACRRLLFVYSSVTESEFLTRLERPFTVLSQHTVPFSLGDNVSSKQLVAAALESDRLIVRESDRQPYAHTLTVAEISDDH